MGYTTQYGDNYCNNTDVAGDDELWLPSNFEIKNYLWDVLQTPLTPIREYVTYSRNFSHLQIIYNFDGGILHEGFTRFAISQNELQSQSESTNYDSDHYLIPAMHINLNAQSLCVHEVDNWETIEPTCGVAGVRAGKCKLCNTEISEPIPATGNHDFGAWQVTQAPTTTTAGVQERVCQVCDHKETAVLAQLPKDNFTGLIIGIIAAVVGVLGIAVATTTVIIKKRHH